MWSILVPLLLIDHSSGLLNCASILKKNKKVAVAPSKYLEKDGERIVNLGLFESSFSDSSLIIVHFFEKCLTFVFFVSFILEIGFIDTFFPFDPYLLRVSSKYIAPAYLEWKGVDVVSDSSDFYSYDDDDRWEIFTQNIIPDSD